MPTSTQNNTRNKRSMILLILVPFLFSMACVLVYTAPRFLVITEDRSLFKQQDHLTALYVANKTIAALKFTELSVASTGYVSGESPVCGSVHAAPYTKPTSDWVHFGWKLSDPDKGTISALTSSLGYFDKQSGSRAFLSALTWVEELCEKKTKDAELKRHNELSWTDDDIDRLSRTDELSSLVRPFAGVLAIVEVYTGTDRTFAKISGGPFDGGILHGEKVDSHIHFTNLLFEGKSIPIDAITVNVDVEPSEANKQASLEHQRWQRYAKMYIGSVIGSITMTSSPNYQQTFLGHREAPSALQEVFSDMPSDTQKLQDLNKNNMDVAMDYADKIARILSSEHAGHAEKNEHQTQYRLIIFGKSTGNTSETH